MLSRILDLLSGNYNEKEIRKLQPIVYRVNELYNSWMDLSDADIKAKTTEFRERLAQGESLDDLLPEAFATVKQACKRLCGTVCDVRGDKREWNMIPYDVQLIGGMILHKGNIAEMKTGEGKTLVAALPVYLNALEGKGVHVVTVNDYLASRDAAWMAYLYEWMGLSIGCVVKNTPLQERRSQYEKDITYVENSELGFDYLRDNLVQSMQERNLLRRPLNYAIVDEVDSILIDEARTPLIISEPDKEPTDKYAYYAKLVKTLVPAKGKKKVKKGFLQELLNDVKNPSTQDEDDQTGDYFIDEKSKTAILSSQGIEKLEKILGVENLYRDLGYEEIHHIENCLKAQAVYKKDREYMVRDGQVLIIDEHTGRAMPGRRFSEGLHQSIEAKEGLQIQKESRTLATITYQNFFKIFKKLAGMTGTATTEGEEFDKIYDLSVIAIPTNKPIIRVDHHDKVYFNQNTKWKFIMQNIQFAHEMGQPLLIGTSTIQTSEYVSKLLEEKGIVHNVLNAKFHEQEAHIVANAGKAKSVMVATNMAGRGTDIKLESGLNEKLAKNYIKWIKSEKWVKEGKNQQISFASKKQKSLSDEEKVVGLDARMYSEIEYKLTLDALQAAYEIDEQVLVPNKHGLVSFSVGGYDWVFRFAKKQKENTDPYVQLLVSPEGTTSNTFLVKDFHYGLYILGTEKHESRRIDNQLRGRAGRQGDAGTSVFYVALDDMIMKKMGGEKIQGMARLLLPIKELENLELTQKQFTNSIVRAQKQMEAWHFGIRKHLFEYDSVVDKQRQRMYQKRDDMLAALQKVQEGQELQEGEKEHLIVVEEVQSFVPSVAHQTVLLHMQLKTPVSDFLESLEKEYGLSITEKQYAAHIKDGSLQGYLEQHMHTRISELVDSVDAKNVQLAFTRIYLQTLDKYWIEHIDTMQRLREKVGLMGYAQIDPLVVYKKEAFEHFETLLHNVKQQTLTTVSSLNAESFSSLNVSLSDKEMIQEQQLMGMLKDVTQQLKIPQKNLPFDQPNKKHTNFHGDKVIYEDNEGFEVFEVGEGQKAPSDLVIDTNENKKLRPNDKVSVQYQNGTMEYDVKYKKVKADVESGKCKIVG